MNHIVMIVGFGAVFFKVSRDEKEVLSGSEPYGSSNPEDAARAAIRATTTATRWAAANGGISGLEIIGQ